MIQMSFCNTGEFPVDDSIAIEIRFKNKFLGQLYQLKCLSYANWHTVKPAIVDTLK